MHNKLEAWRKLRGLTYSALAMEIGLGVTAKMAERYCKGTKPRKDGVYVRLHEMSGGEITPNDWHKLPPVKKVRYDTGTVESGGQPAE